MIYTQFIMGNISGRRARGRQWELLVGLAKRLEVKSITEMIKKN
jgi:hypothetical protein